MKPAPKPVKRSFRTPLVVLAKHAIRTIAGRVIRSMPEADGFKALDVARNVALWRARRGLPVA